MRTSDHKVVLLLIQLTFYVVAVDTNEKTTTSTFPNKGLVKSTRVEVLQGLKPVKVEVLRYEGASIGIW